TRYCTGREITMKCHCPSSDVEAARQEPAHGTASFNAVHHCMADLVEKFEGLALASQGPFVAQDQLCKCDAFVPAHREEVCGRRERIGFGSRCVRRSSLAFFDDSATTHREECSRHCRLTCEGGE